MTGKYALGVPYDGCNWEGVHPETADFYFELQISFCLSYKISMVPEGFSVLLNDRM